MKKLLLTALLLAAPAASAQTTPVPAVPATPPPSSPVAASAPPNTAATTTLSLTAQPGTTVELTSTIRTQITLEDVQTGGPGGKPSSAAEDAQLRADFQKAMNAAAQTTTGKLFYKVQGRAADGTVNLLTTVVTSVPGQGSINIRLSQTVAPNGKTQITRVESDNPTVQAVLQRLSPEVLQAQANKGGSLPDLYGQTFTVGQPRTQTTVVDAQAVLGSVFGALASSLGEGNPFGDVKASPLTIRTTTTYRGTNAGGQRVFDMNSSAGTWTIELGTLEGKAAPMHLKMELLDLTQSGQSLYRPDGLLAGQTQTQTMRMRMTMSEPDGAQMQMLLRLNQNVQIR